MDYLSDTSFLIRLWRDRESGPERQFIEQHALETVGLPWIVKAEFLRGAVAANQDEKAVAEFLARYPTVWPTENTLMLYAKLYSDLRRKNQMIGANDLWIAASALELQKPLLTSNTREFIRVPDLRLVEHLPAA